MCSLLQCQATGTLAIKELILQAYKDHPHQVFVKVLHDF